MEKELIVLGAGPGGYVAAIRAAQLGKKVCIIEDKYMGGVCLNVGCIPSKALIHASHTYQTAISSDYLGITSKETAIDFKKLQAWKDNSVVKTLTSGIEALLKKNKVEIIRGFGTFTGKNSLRVQRTNGTEESFTFQQAIIATGSTPTEIPSLPFGNRILDSTGGLNLMELPKKLIIIGGGYIGCELASAYAGLGVNVHILEGTSSILPNFEEDMSSLVVQELVKHGATIETSAMAKSAQEQPDDVTVTYTINGEEKSATADYVLVTVGRKPNTRYIGLETAGVTVDKQRLIAVDHQGRTSNKNIFAIGDVVPGLALAHKASYEGKVAAEAASGKRVSVDYKAMPAVCFTTPELASVGMTLAEAKEAGHDANASKFPYAVNGRAISMHSTEGFVRLVTDSENGKILGAQIAGHSASDLLAELTLAIESGLVAEDIALTVHSHPSLSELLMDVAELAEGFPIHL